MQYNLTSLAAVNAWLGEANNSNTDNALLTRLIGSVSGFIHRYVQRPSFFQQTYNDTYDGTGGTRQLLRNWPVTAITSLSVGTQTIPAAASYGQTGYRLESANAFPPGSPQALDLTGYRFTRGNSNVQVSYTAGYVVQNEPWTIPTGLIVAVTAPYGNWGADAGVTFATGGALTPVTTTPTTGQYAVSPSTGQYTFASADAGKAVLISYSYIPADIEQACIETVAERYLYRSRIGQSSKSLAGQETVSFSLKDMQDYVKESLNPYASVLLL